MVTINCKLQNIEKAIKTLTVDLAKYNVSLHQADTGSAYFRFPFYHKLKMIRVSDHRINSPRNGVWELRSDAMTKRYKGGRIYNIKDINLMLSDLEKVLQ